MVTMRSRSETSLHFCVCSLVNISKNASQFLCFPSPASGQRVAHSG